MRMWVFRMFGCCGYWSLRCHPRAYVSAGKNRFMEHHKGTNGPFGICCYAVYVLCEPELSTLQHTSTRLRPQHRRLSSWLLMNWRQNKSIARAVFVHLKIARKWANKTSRFRDLVAAIYKMTFTCAVNFIRQINYCSTSANICAVRTKTFQVSKQMNCRPHIDDVNKNE